MILSLLLSTALFGSMSVAPPPSTTHRVDNVVVERMLRNELPRRRAYDLSSIQHIRGAVLNHHIPHATGLDIAFYEALSKRPAPSTIVILGPNHQDIGSWPVATTHQAYATAFGAVSINQSVVATLEKDGTAHRLDSLFDIEHSIYAQVIPIAYYFPGTTIVPIAFTSTFPLKQAEALGNHLAQILDTNALVIASIDFSHYHTLALAQVREKRSRALIQTLRVSAANNVDTDSKQSLAVLLAFLHARGNHDVTILEQSNSALIGGSPTYTTGYVIAAMGSK